MAVCFYHNDPDGRLSAFVVKLWHDNRFKSDNLKLVRMEYTDAFPFHHISDGERVYMVDFSTNPTDMERLWNMSGRTFVWIDHHKTAIQACSGLNHVIAGLRSTEYAGCVLTWMSLFGEGYPEGNQEPSQILGDFSRVPDFIQLVGDYDAWRWEFGRRTMSFYYGLLSMDTDPESRTWASLLSEYLVKPEDGLLIDRIINDGDAIIRYRDQYAADYSRSWGYPTVLDGIKAYAVNLARPSSLFFDAANLPSDIELFIGYVDDHGEWNVSIYSKKHDVSEIAKRYGGGGHAGAAGFRCKQLPWE